MITRNSILRKAGISLALLLNGFSSFAAEPIVTIPAPAEATPKKTPWYERLSLRGYTQVRYNRLLETNQNLTCTQCDNSLGSGAGFFVRRARLIVSGDVHERVAVYLQTDFAASASTDNMHFAQIRDVYADLALDAAKEYRFRFGVSKVPFGFENLQSSSNRLALDRTDALNSAVPNERDLGVAFYWAPAEIRKRFQTLTNATLKGSGDYGVVGIGVFNGQTLNKPEQNDNRHVAARVTYPFELPSGQFIETSVQAYTGLFSIPATQRTTGVQGGTVFRDERLAASLIFYPQPFGFQIEGNIGHGPEHNGAANAIERRSLHGGYAQLMYRIPGLPDQNLTTYLRAQYYDGGKKTETDARHHLVREYELGAEWIMNPAFEWTAAYAYADRLTSDGARRNSDEHGQRLRLQVQFNY
jgi:hypothetical protein